MEWLWEAYLSRFYKQSFSHFLHAVIQWNQTCDCTLHCRYALVQFCNHTFDFRPLNPGQFDPYTEWDKHLNACTQPNIFRCAGEYKAIWRGNFLYTGRRLKAYLNVIQFWNNLNVHILQIHVFSVLLSPNLWTPIT